MEHQDVLVVDAKTSEQPSVAHGNRGLWTILLADGIRNAMDMRIGNEGIAFLGFLWRISSNLASLSAL